MSRTPPQKKAKQEHASELEPGFQGDVTVEESEPEDITVEESEPEDVTVEESELAIKEAESASGSRLPT